MSAFNQIVRQDLDHLLNEFEDSDLGITRVPATGDPVSVTAIWEPEDSKMRSAQNEVSHETGKSLVWRGRLHVSSSLTVAETDQWTIDGETWQCVEIGKASGGMRAIDLQRKQRTQTNKSSGMLL